MDDGPRSVPVWAWLVGTRPQTTPLVIAGSGGVLLGMMALLSSEGPWWADVIVFALAFDLAAGFVSNLSQSTRAFWSGQSFFLRTTYVLVHLGAYPFAVWALVSSAWMGGLLSTVLAGKIISFVVGAFRRPLSGN